MSVSMDELLALLNQLDMRVRVRRRNAAQWTSVNEVLLDSEIGLETDTGRIKIGNGTAAWNSLAYVERGLWLSSLGDVDPTTKADGKAIRWNATLGKHDYFVVPSGGGGGGGTNPMPDSVIHWLALRHRNGTAGQKAYFANSPVFGVGLGAAAANSNNVTFSSAVNGLLGANFAGVDFFTLNPAIMPYDNTIIAVVKTPALAQWGSNNTCNISVGTSGSLQFRLVKTGTVGGSCVELVRSQQAGILNDSAAGEIAAASVICITVIVAANGTCTIRRNGTQTATGGTLASTQPITLVGAKNSTEPTQGTILEWVMFDRVLGSTELAQAETYLKGIWGIP